jgi:hypothetical protein
MGLGVLMAGTQVVAVAGMAMESVFRFILLATDGTFNRFLTAQIDLTAGNNNLFPNRFYFSIGLQ